MISEISSFGYARMLAKIFFYQAVTTFARASWSSYATVFF